MSDQHPKRTGYCWYCRWGWPRPVFEIYAQAVRRISWDGPFVLDSLAHAVWRDENFDDGSVHDTLDRVYQTDVVGGPSDSNLEAVEESLILLAQLPEEVRVPRPDYDQNLHDVNDYPPPSWLEMHTGSRSVRIILHGEDQQGEV